MPLARCWHKANAVLFRDTHEGAGVSVNTPLVPVASATYERPAAFADGRASADFIAHLIATVAQAPQTRARRRAKLEEAIAAYRSLGQWPSEPGRALSRSL